MSCSTSVYTPELCELPSVELFSEDPCPEGKRAITRYCVNTSTHTHVSSHILIHIECCPAHF